ncbi:MAG TPA: hypothetical protein VEP91_09965 [Solirubrobacterales bacterium]|nr:hypothetical protein [Solirubrobacterales bacterium]
MPDENRSDDHPLSEHNEPQLQRAVLELLLEVYPRRIRFVEIMLYKPFRERDYRAVIAAIKSLVIACLVSGDETGLLVAGPIARHYHWLMTEVEPLDG